MMHNFFKKREDDQELGAEIKAAMSFRMDDESRDRIRERLVSYAKMKPVRAEQTQFVRRSWTWIVFHPVPVASLILLVAMGGTAGAAESALPGDLLYPIKVSVNEEVRVALATTPEKKAAVAIARAETRLAELETLEERGDIDTETRDEAEERLDVQIRAAEEQTLELEDENGGRMERETRFIAVLRAHENRLIRDRGEGRGGSLDETVVDAAIIAAVPVEEPVAAMLAVDTTLEATATGIAETPPQPAAFAARSAETAHIEVEDAPVAKQEASSFDVRKVRRQERAAEQRIDALEKLLERLEKRGGSYSEARAAFERAQEDLAAGIEALETENLVEASFRFDVALKTSIDARELLTNTPPATPEQPAEEKPQAKRERKRETRPQQAASAAVVASSSTSTMPEVSGQEDEEVATSTEKEEKKDEGGLRSYLNRKLHNENGIRFWK